MKPVSDKFKESIKKYGRQIDAIITYTDKEGEHLLDSDVLFSITPTVNGNILKSVMKQLEFESSVKVPKGAIIKAQLGVQIDLSLTVSEINAMLVERLKSTSVNLLSAGLKGFEYITFGNYIVSEEPEYNADTLSYYHKCYDKMLYSMQEYEKLSITYSISIRDYLKKICSHLGLTFKNANDIFANYNKQIKTDLYDGYDYTFRDILDELAQATASTICINENTDELEIRYLNNTQDSINEDYLKDVNVEFGEMYGPINSIVLSRSGESDNVYLLNEKSIEENGLCELKIVDNQIMNDNDRSDYLPDILAKLNGVSYCINDFSSYGITWYELCDMYTVEIGTKKYNCVLFNDEIKITQGLEETIYTEMPVVSETDYTKADKTDRRINKAYIIVDKQNQKIELLVSQQSETSEKLNQVEMTVEGTKETIKSVETKVETAQSTADTANANAQTAQNTADALKTQTIQQVDVVYALSNSSTEAPTSGWQTIAPAWENGKYMWQKTITTYGDGSTKESDATCITGATGATGKTGENGKDGVNGSDGEKGDTGIGVKSIEEQYYLSTSNTSQTGGSWKTTQDTWTSGKYIWTRNKITWTDNTTTYTTAILATGLNNANSTANTANNTANTANNTANTANTNAQNAQKTANANTSKIATTTTKLVEVEKTVEGISQKVKNIEVVTNTVSGTKTLALENCVAGSLLEFNIYGNNEVFNNQDSLIKVYTRNICPTQIKDWEQGSFSGSTGETMTYSNSLRLVNMIEIDNTEITLSVQDNNYCLYFIYIYDSDKNYLGGYSSLDGQKTGTIKLASKTKYMNITLKREDGAVINPAEIANIKPQIEYGSEKTEFIEHNTQLIELGVTEVLRQNDEVQDEYILSNGQAQVTRRVNEDGTTKEAPTTEDLGEYNISLAEGTNTIQIKSYTANIKAKYVIKNAYTDTFATKIETESSITQTAEEINIEVRKKVDENEIISSINQSPEQITIQAEKININGTVSANGNFKVDTEGNMIANNGTFTGGKIELKDSNGGNGVFRIYDPNGGNEFWASAYDLFLGDFNKGIQFSFPDNENGPLVYLYGDGETRISSSHVQSPTITQTSLESIKKNIKKFENGLDKVNNSEIYTYNLKSEQDTDKKHVGFIIGEKYKTPQEVIAKTGDGIDTYTMISILWKAVQELSNKITELEEGR